MTFNDGRVKLGVLWKHVSSKDNTPFLSGRVQEDSLDAAVALLRLGGTLLLVTNNKRPDKKDPDCQLFVMPDRAATESAAAPSPPSKQSPSSRPQQRRNDSPFP